MIAVVLVGGFGTRLRPLTAETPKQMLPIVDRPMIERVLATLAGHGVTEAVLSLGYKPEPFMAAYPDDRCAGVTLHYAVEDEPLDTAGAVRFAAASAGIRERFVVVNGDVLTDLDLAAMWRWHQTTGAEGTIALTPVDDPSRFGVVPTDSQGRVEAFIEKPPRDEAPSHWINAGTYVLEPSVLDRIPGGRRVSIERETFPAMVEQGTLYGMKDPSYWVDAGTPAAYLDAQLHLVDGTRGSERAVALDATIASDAVVQHSVVMARCSIGDGALVRGSVLLPGATVHRDAQVIHSIVGPDAVVEAGAIVDELTVVGHDAVVRRGSALHGARIPEAD